MPSIAGIKAGNAYVVIGAIDDTGKVLAKIGRNIRRWGASLTSLGTDVLFKGLLASFPAVGMLNWTADFDDKMKRVQARTGATDNEMNTLAQTARTVGRDIGFTAREIATILDTLSQREFGLGDMQKMVRPIALLAKATGTGSEQDTEQAGRLMSQVLNSFNIAAVDSGKVADILAVAANKSNFALNDLREAMSKVGPFAAQMNMSLEETVAIMSMMRNVEIEAENAGIAMRNILLNASDAKATDKFNESLKSMGQSAIEFTDKMGNLKDPVQILFEVFNVLKKLGTAQRADLLGALFGKRAAVPAMVAGSSQKAFDELMKQIRNAGGEAQRISLQMETGLGGAFRKIKTSAESLAITIGNTLTPMIQGLTKGIVDLLNKMNAWVAAHPRAAGQIALVIAGVAALGVALIALGLVFKLVGFAVGTLGVVFIALKTVITIVMVALGTVFSLMMTVLGIIPPLVGFIASTIAGLASIIWGAISAFATFMASLLATASLPTILLTLVNVFILIAGAAVIAGALGGKALRAMFDGAMALIQAVGHLGRQIWQYLGGVWARISDAAIRSFAVLGAGLGAAFQLAAVGKFQLAMETALKSLNVAWLELRNVMMDVWDEVRSKALTVLNAISAKIDSLIIDVVAFAAKLGVLTLLDEGKITPAQAKAQFDAIEAGRQQGQAMLRGGGKVGIDAAAKARRQKELDDARKAFQDQMKKIAPDLKDAGQIFDDLEKKLRGLGQNQPPGQNPVQQMAMAGVKALDPLEKGTIEAAKAAYESALAGEIGGDDAEQQMAAGINEIAENTAAIRDNLQVA